MRYFTAGQEEGMSSNRVTPTENMEYPSASSGGATAAQTLEELLLRNAELEAALSARARENVLLNEVISTVGSTLKVDEVLRHLVDTIVRAISCHAAFIYLYEKEKERLVLSSTSSQYQHLVGKIELAMGEG